MIRKVIIINPVNFHNLRPPLGLLTISTKFIENGVDVIWIDADVIRDNHKVIAKVKQHLDAELIAMGGMHTVYPNIKELCQLFMNARIEIPTIIGGRVASTLDHLIWSNIPGVDILCKQEGEYVVDSICDNFPDLDKIKGIEYRSNGKKVSNETAPTLKNMDEYPSLRYDLLSNEYFFKQTGYLLTARGYPFRCHFCRTADAEPEKYRSMSVEKIVIDIEYLVSNHNVKRVVLVDEFFLQDKKRVLEFCDHIKKLNIKWQCSCRADTFKEGDYPLLQKMKSAGCDRIVIGIESGSQQMLKLMNKKLDLRRAEKSIELIRKARLQMSAMFIFGYPGETRDTALESVRWRKKMKLPYRFFYAQPYPGSELYNVWKKKFAISPEEEEKYMLSSPGIKKATINFTDMADWRLKLLAFECIIRLNGLAWIIMYFVIYPFAKINPEIPEMARHFAVRMKRLLTKKSLLD
jgi:anaerobic magnesium-protoporphyrin IX monomethyl ester cyclase